MVFRKPLPIDPLLPDVTAALRAAPAAIVQASPGSGKTTRIPPYLLDAGLMAPAQEILVLVPRRLAAKMAALRVAEERGEEPGGTVGYQFRFEHVAGPKTRLKFLTEGMLLRYLVQDPQLRRAGIVILDEFHERHLHSDVALSYLRHLQRSSRPDLKLIVMSATLQTEGLAAFLPEAKVLQLEAAPHEVRLEYLPGDPRRPLEQQVAAALELARREAPAELRRGDALVFLPGMAEIRRCAEALERRFAGDALILPLHGDLPREAQARVFAPADRPKVILATNVAETSLTIEGVRIVIDSGLHRQASYSWWTGIPALKTRPISKAAAIQRAGRAGRTASGICYRLYSKSDWESRLAFETPEIRRSDLTQTLLEMKAMGVVRWSDWVWFEAPPPGAVEACSELLFRLGAQESVAPEASLTPRGRRMAELPVHPRLARLLLEAEAKGCLEVGAWLAAKIAEDALEEGEVLHQATGARGHEGVKKLHRHLLGYFPGRRPDTKSDPEALAYCLLSGFPDRVAQRRSGAASREKQRALERSADLELVFAAGGSGTLRNAVTGPGNYFVVLDARESQGHGQTQGKIQVRALAEIREEWLLDWQGSLLKETAEILWDERIGKLYQVERLQYGQLVLSEQRAAPRDAEAAEQVFCKAVLGLDFDPEGTELEVPALLARLQSRLDTEPLEEILSRLAHLHRAFSAAGAAEFSGAGLTALLKTLLRGLESRAQLEPDSFRAHLEQNLPPETLTRLHRELPRQLSLQAGRRVRVHYPWGKEPWVESRLQDFFGMKEGPKLAGGRVPLLLHLLAPNQRAVQVTRDLAGFWRNTYPEIRKQLMRRYPKHRWPENPTGTA